MSCHEQTEAEHLPGCNMAFRKEALEAVGGFDSRFRAAGDDVDMCWQLQAVGLRLAFSPAAVVWHRAAKTIGLLEPAVRLWQGGGAA